MLKTFVYKEIQNNLLSFRFLVVFTLLIATVVVTVFVLTNDYVKKQDEYLSRQAELEEYLRDYAHFNRVGALAPSQPPLPFYSLVRGLVSDENIDQFDNDPLPIIFPLIDMVFIVTILLSLVALLFSYDSISGRKEDGTLKLVLSNCISRSTVILGKIIGGTVTVLIPFLLSLIIGLIFIFLNPRVEWKGSDWGTLGLVFVGSVLYFSLFYVLGILISSRHRSSSSSIMTGLFVWVLFILVIPNLSPYIASFLAKTPSRIQVGREVDRLTDVERDNLGRRLAREKRQEIFQKYPFLTEKLSEAQLQQRLAQDPDYKRAYKEMVDATSGAWKEANRIQNEKAAALKSELERREEAQTRLSIRISMLSPLCDFVYLASALSSTGMRNLKHFKRLSDIFWTHFEDYKNSKLEALRGENPAKDWWNTHVDMSDRPRFHYREEALAGRFKSTLPFFAVLIVFNILFFAAAFVSFARYDVR